MKKHPKRRLMIQRHRNNRFLEKNTNKVNNLVKNISKGVYNSVLEL